MYSQQTIISTLMCNFATRINKLSYFHYQLHTFNAIMISIMMIHMHLISIPSSFPPFLLLFSVSPSPLSPPFFLPFSLSSSLPPSHLHFLHLLLLPIIPSSISFPLSSFLSLSLKHVMGHLLTRIYMSRIGPSIWGSKLYWYAL